jgi:hypothetical protein
VTRASDRATLRLIGRLAFGFAIGAAPLVAYHALTGSLADWFRDSFIDAVGVSASAHIEKPTYLVYLIVAPMRIFQADSFGQVVNAVFWPILTLQAALLGGLVFRHVRQGSTPQDLALPFLAVFYGVIALHY